MLVAHATEDHGNTLRKNMSMSTRYSDVLVSHLV